MIKPNAHYIILTPSGNDALQIGKENSATKFTMQQVDGRALKTILTDLPALQVERMRLFEIKDELIMQPVTTINVSAKKKEKRGGGK